MKKIDKVTRVILKGAKLIVIAVVSVALMGMLFLTGVNLYMKQSVKKRILTVEAAAELNDVDCILVLGASVYGDSPSPMLADRVQRGVDVYKAGGGTTKLLMSGDHGGEYYDEVNVMKKYAKDEGVPSEDIFMDHAGFSSYDSIYRAKEIFQANKVVIVTQKYHLYRSIYIAKKLGMEAYGVASNPRPYAGQWARETREIVARNKDFFKVLIKPQSTYLGETIPVSGNGNATNDK